MKNLFLLLCMSLTFSHSFSQSLLEKILSNDIKLAISDGVRYDDGNWIFSAFAYSITPGDSAMSIVFKTDSTFTPIWAKRYQFLKRDDFSCLTPLADGNILVGGTMRQDFSLDNGGSVFKLDTAGNVIWHKMYNEDFDDRVLDIFEQADSTLMIFIREGVTNRPTKIVHASKDGNILRQRTYSIETNLGMLANNVVADENEQYYFSGTIFQGTSEAYVCSVNDSNFLWYKRFRFSGRSVGSFSSSYIPEDQTIILGGTIEDTVGIFVNIWLLKIDLQGNIIWSKEYGGDLGFAETVSQIKPLANGDFMIFGRAFNEDGSEGFAMKLDSLGNQIWIKGYNPTSPTLGISDVFFYPDGRMLINANSGDEIFLITTTSEGENACNSTDISLNTANLTVSDTVFMESVGNPGIVEISPPLNIYDITIEDSLLCQRSVSISELPIKQLNIYPNPARDQLFVMLPNLSTKPIECVIIDTYGREIQPDIVRDPEKLQMNLSSIATGIYWIVLEIDGKRYTQKFVHQ